MTAAANAGLSLKTKRLDAFRFVYKLSKSIFVVTIL